MEFYHDACYCNYVDEKTMVKKEDKIHELT